MNNDASLYDTGTGSTALGIKSEDRVQHLECCRCDGCATCMLDCGSLVIVMLTVIE